MLPLSLTQSLARLEIPEKKAYATFAWLLFFEPEMTWDLAHLEFEWVLKGDDVTTLISRETSSAFTQAILATGLWLGMFMFMGKVASSSCGTMLFYNY